MPVGVQGVYLRILDVSGRVFEEVPIAKDHRLIELQTNAWPSGFYLVELWSGAERAAALKLGVQH